MHHQKKWFENWFDSPFYHILYKNRDNKEAEYFIDNLVGNLQLKENSKILDLACGKGRHAIYLNKKGFDVVGVDLSCSNIDYAKSFENDHLKFHVHDMRLPFKNDHFDVVLNLFTSLGYFEDEQDNFSSIQSASMALNSGGILLIDFLNSKKVMKNLKPDEIKSVDGIAFTIKRAIKSSFIEKRIQFECEKCSYNFQEHVRLLTLVDFEKYITACGMKIKEVFGDYWLNKFDENVSDRLIIKAVKS